MRMTMRQIGIPPLHRARYKVRFGADLAVRSPSSERRQRRSPARESCSTRSGELVLRLRVEVASVVALVQLARRLAGETVDHAPALHGRPFEEGVGPALDVLVLLHRQEFRRRTIEPALRP